MAVEAYVNLPTPSAPTTGQPTLSGAILAGAVSFVVSSNTNAPAAAPFRCIIDDEIFYVSARPSTTWTVAGAQEGTSAANHGNGATVVVAGVLTTASLKNNPLALTTTGDLPYLNSSGNQARLAIGATSTILTVTAGVPAWTAAPILTTIQVGGATLRTDLNVFGNGTAEYTAADAVSAGLIFQKSRGTVGSEALVNSADVLGQVLFRGFDGNGAYSAYASNSVRLRAVATEAFDATHHGAKFEIATVANASITPTTRLILTDTLLTLSAGLTLAGAITNTSYTASHIIASTQVYMPFSATGGPYVTLTTANIAAQGADQNQTKVVTVAATDTGASKYANVVYQGYLHNIAAGSPFLYMGEVGWEGTYNDAGVRGTTGLTHFYLWDGINSRTMLDHMFELETPVSITDAGLRVGSVFNKTFTSATTFPLAKNDVTVATYASLSLKPIFNTGGSNTNTTVNVLDIDTTNTAVTGLTVNLINAAYGGTARLTLVSTGQFDIVSESGTNAALTNYAASTVGGVIRGRKFRGTAAAPLRAKSGDVLMVMQAFGAEAVDDSTAATIVGASGSPGQIKFQTTEAFTATGHGTAFQVLTTAIGSVTQATRLTIDENGLTLADAHNLMTGTGTGMKIGTSTSQKLGFFNTTPVIQPTDGATLTNSVTSGGTTDTIANFTDLTLYANDSAAIRNNFYQLARKVKIITDNLRSLGLES